jgi:hypothetical protein
MNMVTKGKGTHVERFGKELSDVCLWRVRKVEQVRRAAHQFQHLRRLLKTTANGQGAHVSLQVAV